MQHATAPFTLSAMNKLCSLPILLYFSVPVLDVAVGVLVVPAPATLLFRLSFLSFFSFAFGVLGLFSPPFVAFRTGAGRSSVFNGGGGGTGTSISFTGVATLTLSDCDDLLVVIEDVNVASCDFVKRKEPGSPTMGFSSMYSLP